MSALEERNVPIAIVGLDQKPSSVDGPAGRLISAVNVDYEKFSRDGAPSLQVGMRAGFNPLSPDLESPVALLTEHNGNPVVVCEDGSVQAYEAEPSPHWRQANETQLMLPNATREAQVWRDALTQSMPDVAFLVDVFFYTWKARETGTVGSAILTPGGDVVRSGFVFANGKAKVVADTTHTYFAVVYQVASQLSLVYYTRNGISVHTDGALLTLDSATAPWDVTFAEGNVQVCAANATASHVDQTASVFDGVTYTKLTSSHSPGFAPNGACWLTNASASPHAVIACTSPASAAVTCKTFEVAPDGTEASTATAFTGVTATVISQLAGFYTGATGAVVPTVFYSAPGATLFSTATTRDYVTAAGTFPVINGVVLLTRVFKIGTRLFVGVGYPSQAIAQEAALGTPTGFLYDVTFGTFTLCGRYEYDNLYMAWTYDTYTSNDHAPRLEFFSVSSVATDGDGNAVFADCTNGTLSLSYGFASPSAGGARQVRARTTSAVSSYSILATAGESAALRDTTILPGPIALEYDGAGVAGAGIEMPPDPLNTPGEASVGSGPFKTGEKRSYVVVYEKRDRRGKKLRSPSGWQKFHTTVGNLSKTTLQLPTLRQTTHTDLIISVYRTQNNGSVHYKITDDTAPIANDPSTNYIAFTDGIADSLIGASEILYGGTGANIVATGGGDGSDLDHEMMPAFSRVVVLRDRMACVAANGNLYFSAAFTDADHAWWSSLFAVDPRVDFATLASQ